MPPPPRNLTFRELIEREYLAKGLTRHDVACLVKVQSGVSFGAQRKAFEATAVKPRTAQDLAAWAFRTHKVKLDTMALVMAPTRPRKRSPA